MLSPPSLAPPRALLQEAGAFVWWYVDLLDAHGSGLVLIWSFGLPFLPGLRRAARAGEDARPAAWPALNLALYERGRTAFYALQRLEERSACWRTHEHEAEWRFGDTRIHAWRRNGRVHLRALLDISLPAGERASGLVELVGPERCPALEESSRPKSAFHEWSPLSACARGRAELTLSGEPFLVEGRAYHDRNFGIAPLWDLDIRRWLWGRLPFPGHELTFCTLWPHGASRAPETVLLVVDESGRTRRASEVQVTLARDALRWSGLRLPRTVDVRFRSPEGAPEHVRLRRREVVDEGPFYARFLVEATSESAGRPSQRALGFAEGIVPRRVDRSRHRPFVRMRVHEVAGSNSLWLPLFSGRKRGRAARLVRSWIPQAFLGGARA